MDKKEKETPADEESRDEIERAIDNAKRSDWDRTFRRMWYKAAARRRFGMAGPGGR